MFQQQIAAVCSSPFRKVLGGDVWVSPHNCKEFIALVLFCNKIPYVCPMQWVLQPIRILRIGVKLTMYHFFHIQCSRVNLLLTFWVPHSKYRAPYFWQTLTLKVHSGCASPKNGMASNGQRISEMNGDFPQDGSRHWPLLQESNYAHCFLVTDLFAASRSGIRAAVMKISASIKRMLCSFRGK